MKNLMRLGFTAFVFGLGFFGVQSADAQTNRQIREARREYRDEVRDARRDRRRDIRNGTSRREANREFRNEVRDARRDYRNDTGRRINRGYYISRARRAYPQARYRVYYRNGRRYVVRY